MSRRTISRPTELSGTGLHSGAAVHVQILPGAPGSGIMFRRLDADPGRPIPARLGRVAATDRRTTLRAGAVRVDTIEHLLAAVAALEITDLDIAVTGPEIPILDGSFAPFVSALRAAGLQGGELGGAPAVELKASVESVTEAATYRAEPADRFGLDVELVYREPVIGRQSASGAIDPEWFTREIAPARTFGFLVEVEPMRQRGLLLGATADCAIVLGPDRPLNTTLRWPNEFARHKLGDLLGDLALMGFRPRARITASRPSHRGNIAFARTLAAACGQMTEE